MYFCLISKNKYIDRIPGFAATVLNQGVKFQPADSTKCPVTYCWFQIPLMNILVDLKFLGVFFARSSSIYTHHLP